MSSCSLSLKNMRLYYIQKPTSINSLYLITLHYFSFEVFQGHCNMTLIASPLYCASNFTSKLLFGISKVCCEIPLVYMPVLFWVTFVITRVYFTYLLTLLFSIHESTKSKLQDTGKNIYIRPTIKIIPLWNIIHVHAVIRYM